MSLSIDEIEKALIQANGNISGVAEALKVTRAAIHKRIKNSPRLAELASDLREKRIDKAEDKLSEFVEKGEAWAVCFALKTIGKSRGYVERQEHTAANGAALIPQKFIVEIVTNDGTGSTTNKDQD